MKKQEDQSPGDIRAMVGIIRGDGAARFAVTYPQDAKGQQKDITFSLSDWDGDHEPRKGQMVVLSEIQLFAKGWRALKARPILFDQEQSQQEERSEATK
jgi:hypothetical protein